MMRLSVMSKQRFDEFEFYASDYFKVVDLEDGDLVLTVKAIEPKEMGDGEEKLVAFFDESDKGLVLNRTNVSFLIAQSGSKQIKACVGLKVRLTAIDTEYQGRAARGLRLRALRAAAAEPAVASKPKKKGESPVEKPV